MFSREILENALQLYTGTVLCVSHDRYFINQTAQRILELSGQELTVYYGNYDYYLEKKAQEAAAAESRSATARPGGSSNSAHTTGSSAAGRPAAGSDAAPAPAGSKTEWAAKKQEVALARKRAAQLKATEEKIAALEEEDGEIDAQLSDETVFTDSDKVFALTTRKAALQAELEELYALWETLA